MCQTQMCQIVIECMNSIQISGVNSDTEKVVNVLRFVWCKVETSQSVGGGMVCSSERGLTTDPSQSLSDCVENIKNPN